MGNQTVIRWAAGSLLAAAVCVFGLVWLNTDFQKTAKPPLQVWCAASLKAPLEELAARYEQEFGTQVILQFGGSGALLTTIKATNAAGVFIPADSSYLAIAQEKGLGSECHELAMMCPVLVVSTGNPKQVRGWQDLLNRPDLKLGLCHPASAAIGMMVKSIAQSRGDWESLQASADVMKGTVSELALDLKTGALDVAFVWDQTVAAMRELEKIPCDELAGHSSTVAAMVLTSSQSTATSLHFARWIASPEHGKPVFRKHHFVESPKR